MKQKGHSDFSEVMKDLAASLVLSPTDSVGNVPLFPLLATLAAKLLVVPADCERGFSALSRTKTRTHNRLITENFDSLLLTGRKRFGQV